MKEGDAEIINKFDCVDVGEWAEDRPYHVTVEVNCVSKEFINWFEDSFKTHFQLGWTDEDTDNMVLAFEDEE